MLSAIACSKPAPKGIEALRAQDRDVELMLVGQVEGGTGFDAYLYAYESAGLKVHALVALQQAPAKRAGAGWIDDAHGELTLVEIMSSGQTVHTGGLHADMRLNSALSLQPLM